MAIYDKWSPEEKWKFWRELGGHLESVEKREAIKEVAEPVSLRDSYQDYLQRKEAGSKGLRTGFKKLDEAFDGLCKSSVYVIGGATGVGKTLFVCNLVMNVVLAGAHTLFLTTEMPHYQVTSRMRQLWNEHLADDENFQDLPISYLDNKFDISIELIEQLLIKNRQRSTEGIEEKYTLLAIDNLQWFSRGGANIAESTGLATQAMKKLAIEYDIPIILVSHLSRLASNQDMPDMNTLKNSSYIEQDADAVIMISRDIDGVKYRKDSIQVAVRKNRLTGELCDFSLVTNENNTLKQIATKDVSR